MDQANNAFVPHLLVVQTGTSVLFPNNDVVSHHVYSFSEAKTFELGLYKGDVYPPVQFDTPGIVVLGCNIHDGMLGYILVVDTPYYAMTDEHGPSSSPALADGDYTIDLWTPRARPNALPAAAARTSTSPSSVVSSRRQALARSHHGAASLSWERYYHFGVLPRGIGRPRTHKRRAIGTNGASSSTRASCPPTRASNRGLPAA